MISGSNNANSGNIMISPMHTKCNIMKGMTPRYISASRISGGLMPLKKKIAGAMGGVR
jgi:hypothetical protein